MKGRAWAFAALLGAAWVSGAGAATDLPAEPRAEGLWEGWVVYSPAEAEVEIIVEIARDAEGELVGTIDIPSQRMKFHPLDSVTLEERRLTFDWLWVHQESEGGETRARFLYEGEISDDGAAVRGTVSGWENPSGRTTTFELARIGEAGDERPERSLLEVTTLGGDLGALRRAFNGAAGQPRLLLLISPTCAVCLISASLVQRYVVDAVDDPRLKVFVVWGPMLGDEEEGDAHQATAFLSDPRVEHFWTPSPEVAELFQKPLGLEDEPAWDTYLLFSPEASWGEAVPAPAYFMHIGRSLPEDRRLNGEELARQARALLRREGPR